MPTTTRRSPIESLKLPTSYSREEFERACEFVKKVKEIDEEQNHRGIFTQYVTAMKLYRSGSLNMVEVKNRITTIFKNCDVLLDGFYRIMKDSDLDSLRDHIVIDLKRMVEFLKALRKESERLRLGFLEAFVRFKEHKDGQVLNGEVDLMLRNYPFLKEEFRMILLENGIVQDEKRDEITFDREDEMFEKDMYFHSIESAIKFAAAEEDKKRKKPPAGVYGAMRRLYAQRRRPLPRGFMRDPKLAVRRVLSPLQWKHNELLKKKNRRKLLKKVQKVNESLVVFKFD
ncbi:unnamed protein product [Arabidopsis lyrata]|uniref:Uncharacterized protein n=1 Tax=Arabidopsis lyrata subsp. lyrata TaxID=81972 RepID=D7L490_ARALL|nr:uncharacterized protein LOC9321682 [Arabidopsis lyrata subsp. lyrata]EFH59747.1 hypothetical protein ARALYDRAFT_898965 [Arabidopsis lyrata subsp. lyrata]CAH8261646.1 unnamed protein product [Arabidopsis lyrata]|eukprot:XP_002883488.1 uncharacterized protein LOC9321682 [Arabidopsis lyrata subsp. lyrata]